MTQYSIDEKWMLKDKKFIHCGFKKMNIIHGWNFIHSWMNVDVTTTADVDASGWWWMNYYGMCHLWQCATPSTMGHHSWHWCAPPHHHPTKLFFHTILDEPNIWPWMIDAIFHPQWQSPNDWITCKVEGRGSSGSNSWLVCSWLSRETEIVIWEREREREEYKRLYFLKAGTCIICIF
jgi:hypothetical protein